MRKNQQCKRRGPYRVGHVLGNESRFKGHGGSGGDASAAVTRRNSGPPVPLCSEWLSRLAADSRTSAISPQGSRQLCDDASTRPGYRRSASAELLLLLLANRCRNGAARRGSTSFGEDRPTDRRTDLPITAAFGRAGSRLVVKSSQSESKSKSKSGIQCPNQCFW